jgi:uncharacterized protein YbjT (DUF2867 family)
LVSSSTDDGPVLVTGATGHHGRAVVEALLAAGRRVRALTRNPDGSVAQQLAARGAEVAHGDLLDRESLLGAMTGSIAVYAVTTPFSAGPDGEVQQGEQLIAATRAANVPWLILASVASADRRTGIPHFESKWRIERELQASSLAHTVVAPTYFYENVGDAGETIGAGELSLPLSPSRPLQQVALMDLGALVVAVVNRREEFLGARLEVAGDQPTPRQMADALSRTGERPVRYRQIGLDEVAARSSDLAAMYRFLEETGYQVDISALRDDFPEISWTTFAAWARASVSARRPQADRSDR